MTARFDRPAEEREQESGGGGERGIDGKVVGAERGRWQSMKTSIKAPEERTPPKEEWGRAAEGEGGRCDPLLGRFLNGDAAREGGRADVAVGGLPEEVVAAGMAPLLLRAGEGGRRGAGAPERRAGDAGGPAGARAGPESRAGDMGGGRRAQTGDGGRWTGELARSGPPPLVRGLASPASSSQPGPAPFSLQIPSDRGGG